MIYLATKVLVQAKLAGAYFEEAPKAPVDGRLSRKTPPPCSGRKGEGFFLQGKKDPAGVHDNKYFTNVQFHSDV